MLENKCKYLYMDPLFYHSINKFRLMYIPDLILKQFPPFLGSFIMSLLPITPINIIIFLLLFTLIFSFNPFNLSKSTTYQCKGGEVSKTLQFSLWTTIKNTYYFYFIVSYVVNLLSLSEFQMLNLNSNFSLT